MSARATRYEQLLQGVAGEGLSSSMARASRRARDGIEVASDGERCVRDVAAGVAGPTLVAYVVWLLRRIEELGGERAYFLSRDGQVLHLLASRLAPVLGSGVELVYLYSSRRTWNLAATSTERLAEEAWLFGSFMRSNAADLCERLGIPMSRFAKLLEGSGVSLDPDKRSDDPPQRAAMERFLKTETIRTTMAERIDAVRSLTLDYVEQERVTAASAVLVDLGWTGRMVGALAKVLAEAGISMPPTLFWGYQPKGGVPVPGIDISAYMYDTSHEAKPRWLVPDIPFLMESFAMADHGIVSGYHRDSEGTVRPVLDSPDNPSAERWGLQLYRLTLTKFCDALIEENCWEGDARPVLFDSLCAFWTCPTALEARVWGSYLYDSDPTGSAARPLARGFSGAEVRRSLASGRFQRGDRAWIPGSLALTSPALRTALSRVDMTPARDY